MSRKKSSDVTGLREPLRSQVDIRHVMSFPKAITLTYRYESQMNISFMYPSFKKAQIKFNLDKLLLTSNNPITPNSSHSKTQPKLNPLTKNLG